MIRHGGTISYHAIENNTCTNIFKSFVKTISKNKEKTSISKQDSSTRVPKTKQLQLQIYLLIWSAIEGEFAE